MDAKNVRVEGIDEANTAREHARRVEVRCLAKLEALSDMFALRDHVDADERDERYERDEKDAELTFDADEFASMALDAE